MKRTYGKTIAGLVTSIYHNQLKRSKKRGHKAPDYTAQELREWLSLNGKFEELYTAWVESNYEKNLSPSLNRLDDSKGYSFSNMEVVTWKENNEKAHLDHKSGILNYDCKAVEQYDKSGKYIATHHSTREAARATGALNHHISAVCKGKNNSAGGFKWLYAEDSE